MRGQQTTPCTRGLLAVVFEETAPKDILLFFYVPCTLYGCVLLMAELRSCSRDLAVRISTTVALSRTSLPTLGLDI